MRYFANLGVVAIALSWGCSQYNYGPPPLPPAGNASPVERCVAQKSLLLSASSGTEHLMNETSGDGTYIYVRGRSSSADGYTFYRGQERLSVEDGLTELGEPSLTEADRRALDEDSGAKTRHTISKPLWIGLMSAGVVLSIVGIATLKGDDGKLNGSALAITGVGVGLELTAIPFILMAYNSNEGAAAYDLRKNLYLPPANGQARLEGAIGAQHARVAQQCRAPMNPQ